MEYLMTYGWAMLVIAVVMIALYQLGILGGNQFDVRVQPGSCQVVRPGGVGSVTDISLQGICGGALPEYVMQGFGVGDFGNVAGSNSVSSPLNINGNSITITAWVYVIGSPWHDVVDKEGQYGMKLDYNNSPHPCSPSNNTGLCLEWDTPTDWNGISFPIPNATFRKWIFLAVTQGGASKSWYADGVLIGSNNAGGQITYSNADLSIGAISPGWTGYGEYEWFNGSISNVQIYNSSLSAAEIEALYLEGIGGTPLDLQHLVGWWPLNGNMNDYSGNRDNGEIFNNSFSGTWNNDYVFT